MDMKQRFREGKERRERHQAWLATLPEYAPGMVVRCPLHNADGTPISDGDVKGCGSTNVTWDGEVYDCNDCCIFFASYAADPPHQRKDDDEEADRDYQQAAIENPSRE
jgi:hypothetical protein